MRLSTGGWSWQRLVQRVGLGFAVLLGSGCAQDDLIARLKRPVTCEARGDCADAGDAGHPSDGGDAGSAGDAGDGDDAGDAGCRPVRCSVTSGSQRAFCDATDPLAQLGDGCAEARGIPKFNFAICSCSELVTTSPLHVDGGGEPAVAVNGDFHTGSDISIEGDVAIGGTRTASSAAGVRGQILEHVTPAPCPCGEAEIFDTLTAVAARSSDNDNGDMRRDLLASIDGARSLELACGRYYLTRISGSGPLRIRASGNVAIYVGGDISLDSNLVIDGDPGSSVSLFVAGNVHISGQLASATRDSGAIVRLVVGGSGTVDLNGDVVASGLLYAPRADLVTRGHFELTGALLAERVNPSRELFVHYDGRFTSAAADSCE